ncbi:YhfC family intramembrane metalloprotease [Pseudobutyrivibrio sp. LB2011]|uniref:YhfC family intramembrane metalloprotease n=1 Tax=Pseudobutyrivibrio sp. LB2011 TaxID=1408312 RepID=UPI0005D1A313|nr:YhfC family glutamic-type intramembrane protease [Pseudobutyrivibrio sp. LB2011]
METVSLASIIGMCFTLLISFGLPIGLLLYAMNKLKAKMISFWIGAATFVVFALVLEQLLHIGMINQFGEALTGNILIKAIYGGLAAGIFEEVGRFISMKLFMKRFLNKENAFMYGVGHGGIEAMIIVGMTTVSNLISAYMINTGLMEKSLELFDSDIKQQTIDQLTVLWTTSPVDFYMAGVERVVAITLHLSLSYIVYRAVKDGKIQLLFLSIALHAFADFVTVLVAGYAPVIVVEIVLIVLVSIIAVVVYKKFSAEQTIAIGE